MKKGRTKKVFALLGVIFIVFIIGESIYFFSKGDFYAGSYFFPLLLLLYVFFVNR